MYEDVLTILIRLSNVPPQNRILGETCGEGLVTRPLLSDDGMKEVFAFLVVDPEPSIHRTGP
jgi:hypothetical protein